MCYKQWKGATVATLSRTQVVAGTPPQCFDILIPVKVKKNEITSYKFNRRRNVCHTWRNFLDWNVNQFFIPFINCRHRVKPQSTEILGGFLTCKGHRKMSNVVVISKRLQNYSFAIGRTRNARQCPISCTASLSNRAFYLT